MAPGSACGVNEQAAQCDAAVAVATRQMPGSHAGGRACSAEGDALHSCQDYGCSSIQLKRFPVTKGHIASPVRLPCMHHTSRTCMQANIFCRSCQCYACALLRSEVHNHFCMRGGPSHNSLHRPMHGCPCHHMMASRVLTLPGHALPSRARLTPRARQRLRAACSGGNQGSPVTPCARCRQRPASGSSP